LLLLVFLAGALVGCGGDADPSREAETGQSYVVPPDDFVTLANLFLKDLNRCVGIAGADRGVYPPRGTNAVLWDCNGFDDKKWSLIPVGAGFELQNKHTNLCLGVAGWPGRPALANPGNTIVQWDCNGADDKIWLITDQGALVNSAGPGLSLCLAYKEVFKRSTLILNWCDGAADQVWLAN
jgi:hypothetical protein